MNNGCASEGGKPITIPIGWNYLLFKGREICFGCVDIRGFGIGAVCSVVPISNFPCHLCSAHSDFRIFPLEIEVGIALLPWRKHSAAKSFDIECSKGEYRSYPAKQKFVHSSNLILTHK
jgi:hypothetical protein